MNTTRKPTFDDDCVTLAVITPTVILRGHHDTVPLGGLRVRIEPHEATQVTCWALTEECIYPIVFSGSLAERVDARINQKFYYLS